MKTLYIKPLLLPLSTCVIADGYVPKEETTFFLGNADTDIRTEISITFSAKSEVSTADWKNEFIDFYNQVQSQHDGYFVASLPIFKGKSTHLFRMENIINHDFIGSKYKINCDTWCCWEYSEAGISEELEVWLYDGKYSFDGTLTANGYVN